MFSTIGNGEVKSWYNMFSTIGNGGILEIGANKTSHQEYRVSIPGDPRPGCFYSVMPFSEERRKCCEPFC